MSFDPDPMQRLLLWRLAVSEAGGEFFKNIEASSFGPSRRKPLVREGLIEEDKRRPPQGGRKSIYLELTDKGWAWCQNHLDQELRFRGQTPKLAAVTLSRLLGLMKEYFQHQDHTVTLGQLVQQARPGKPTRPTDRSEEDGQRTDLEQSVRQTCLELGDGRENVRVRLADLRSRLNGVPRSALDRTLLEMERAGRLSLYPLDNPREIRPEDRDAVLRTATGQDRHIVYFGGRAS